MVLPDLNVLLYATNTGSPQHRASRTWLETALGGSETVGFAWIVLVGYLRLSTRAGIFPRPLDAPTAVGVARTWLSAPTASAVEPGPRHLEILGRLITGSGTAGNLANDAHLAAIAIELRATVVTYDRDLGRFGVPLHLPS